MVLSGNVFALDEYKSSHIGKTSGLNAVNGNDDGDSNKPLVTLSHEEVYSSFEIFDYCVGDVFKTINRVDIFQDGLLAIFG